MRHTAPWAVFRNGMGRRDQWVFVHREQMSSPWRLANDMPDLDLSAQLLNRTPVQHLITIYSLTIPLLSSQRHEERASRNVEAVSHPDHWRIQSWEEHPIEEMVWIG